MATKKPTAQAVKQEAEATPAAERKITVAKLREACVTLFDISPSTFDGAAYGLEGEYTVEEMRGIINDWLNKEVM